MMIPVGMGVVATREVRAETDAAVAAVEEWCRARGGCTMTEKIVRISETSGKPEVKPEPDWERWKEELKDMPPIAIGGGCRTCEDGTRVCSDFGMDPPSCPEDTIASRLFGGSSGIPTTWLVAGAAVVGLLLFSNKRSKPS